MVEIILKWHDKEQFHPKPQTVILGKSFKRPCRNVFKKFRIPITIMYIGTEVYIAMKFVTRPSLLLLSEWVLRKVLKCAFHICMLEIADIISLSNNGSV